MLTLLPISLFGMSVAAAALPDLSREVAGARNDQLAEQIGIGLRRILFFVAPSAFVYAACGGLIVGTLFETGQFTATDTAVTAGVLAAYAIGLPAQASVRLIASGFYALGDTRTPVRIAALTVALSAGLAASAMQVFGVAGIALGTAAASYVNVGLLLRGLSRRLGPISLDPAARIPGAVLAGLVGATALTLAVGTLAAPLPRLPETLVALLVFGVVYVGAAAALGHPEARELLRRARLRQGGDR
jgi:putative peptidoglycan lipid II flippase